MDGNMVELVVMPKNAIAKRPASNPVIQYIEIVTKNLDPVFQRGDDFLRGRQF
jgi:hypothetical protein